MTHGWARRVQQERWGPLLIKAVLQEVGGSQAGAEYSGLGSQVFPLNRTEGEGYVMGIEPAWSSERHRATQAELGFEPWLLH